MKATLPNLLRPSPSIRKYIDLKSYLVSITYSTHNKNFNGQSRLTTQAHRKCFATGMHVFKTRPTKHSLFDDHDTKGRTEPNMHKSKRSFLAKLRFDKLHYDFHRADTFRHIRDYQDFLEANQIGNDLANIPYTSLVSETVLAICRSQMTM